MAPCILTTMVTRLWQYLRYCWNKVNFSSSRIIFARLESLSFRLSSTCDHGLSRDDFITRISPGWYQHSIKWRTLYLASLYYIILYNSSIPQECYLASVSHKTDYTQLKFTMCNISYPHIDYVASSLHSVFHIAPFVTGEYVKLCLINQLVILGPTFTQYRSIGL